LGKLEKKAFLDRISVDGLGRFKRKEL